MRACTSDFENACILMLIAAKWVSSEAHIDMCPICALGNEVVLDLSTFSVRSSTTV